MSGDVFPDHRLQSIKQAEHEQRRQWEEINKAEKKQRRQNRKAIRTGFITVEVGDDNFITVRPPWRWRTLRMNATEATDLANQLLDAAQKVP